MTSTPETLAEATAPVAETPAAENPAPSTPEERQKQFQGFMVKMLGDMARLQAQIGFTNRHFQGELANIHDRLDYLTGAVGMLFEALHLEMPKPTPKLLDVQVELVAELNEGEVCECRVAWSSTKHPIFGHLQILLGGPDDAQVANPAQMQPLFVQRLTEACEALRQTEGFVDGQFYYARLVFIHAQPFDATSVPVPAPTAVADATAPAANDDAVTAAETGDVQSE